MPKYITLDQHIMCNHELFEPGTEVEVSPEDVPTWEQLVKLKVAERVTSPEEIEESAEVWEGDQPAPPEDEGVEIDDAQPVPPGA